MFCVACVVWCRVVVRVVDIVDVGVRVVVVGSVGRVAVFVGCNAAHVGTAIVDAVIVVGMLYCGRCCRVLWLW